MARLRLMITKEEEIGYISHLDYARTIERSIRRAHIPAAYSEGFNPHMKIAFASALAVGVTSEAEYLDIELTNEVDFQSAVGALREHMPAGISIKQGTYVSPQTPALMAEVNLAAYRITAPLETDAQFDGIKQCIDDFNEAKQILYIKESPKKGKKEIDIKQYVDYVHHTIKEGKAELIFEVRITPTGSVKPGEILDALKTLYKLPVGADAARIRRTGLYIIHSDGKKTPLE